MTCALNPVSLVCCSRKSFLLRWEALVRFPDLSDLLEIVDDEDDVRKTAVILRQFFPDSIEEQVDLGEDRRDLGALASVSPSEKETPEGKRELKVTSMMLDEPRIEPKALEAITAPTLVLASDHDMILDEHTLEIYHHLPNGELCIFPNATHMVPFDESELFNSTVERFFRTPYVKKDRIKDLMKSYEALKAQVQ